MEEFTIAMREKGSQRASFLFRHNAPVFLDWLTTVAGIVFLDSTEVNPLLSGVTESSKMAFQSCETRCIVLAGFIFRKAAALSKQATIDWYFMNEFQDGGRSLAIIGLSGVVVNSITVLLIL